MKRLIFALALLIATPAAAQQELDIARILSTANLTLLPSGDIVLNPTGKDVLASTNYDINLGSLTKKYLALYAAELLVDTLVAQDVISTIGGRVLIAPTTTLTADLGSGGTTITVKHNQIANGDRLRLEKGGQVEFVAVTSGAGGSAGAYTYTITRNLDGSGANNWIAGDAVLNTGTTGDGFIDLYAVSGVLTGNGPTIVGNVRTGTTYNNIAPRWAIGNLNGVGYGHVADMYGMAAGNPSGAYFYIDDANGLVFAGPGGVKIQLDPSGNASFAGTITAAAGTIGGWTIGSTALTSTGIAIQSGVSGSSYFQVADTVGGALFAGISSGPSSAHIALWAGAAHTSRATAPFRVAFDGSLVATSATITGAITATSGDISGALVANSITSAMIVAGTIQTSDIGANTITSALIDANTITAADIAAGTITATEIAANTITAGNIAANAVDTSELNAGAVTAAKISVSNLAAISADLGTVTAGLIDGVTINAGSGDEVVLNSSGITLTSGTGTNNKIKWSGGAIIYDSGGLVLDGDTTILLIQDVGVNRDLSVGRDTSSIKFISSYLAGGGVVALCADNTGLIIPAGVSGCTAPAPLALVEALERRIADLEQRLAAASARRPR